MRTIVRILTSLFPIGLLALGGCKKIVAEAMQANEHPHADAATVVTAEGEHLGEDQALGEKLNGYVRDCLNRFSRPVRASEERYYSWVDPHKGPAAKVRKVNGIDSISVDPDLCRSAVLRANGRPPNLPAMEKKAEAYVASLDELVPVVNEASSYYARGDYKTDKMAKAKELHPKVVGAFEAFDRADGELAEAVDQVQDDLDRRELLRIERDEGNKAHWHVVRATVLAKPVLHESAKDPAVIDVATLGSSCAAFGGAVSDFEAWAKDNPTDAAKSSKFMGAARDLANACDALGQRLKEKKPFSAAEKRRLGTSAGPMVEGSPDAVLDRYNRVIEAYNVVRY
jgi:hypothetical protein